MAYNDELGRRMKENYEKIPQIKLMRRTPVAIRIDGKAFHTWTKGFKRPFDEILIESMQETMKYLCENIQGCILGYTQSDEITLILQDYKTLTTEAWFNYEVQKMCSVSASMATMAFNKFFTDNYKEWVKKVIPENKLMDSVNLLDYKNELILSTAYYKSIIKGAQFDSRCFNIPKEEVTNLLLWRQLDAMRNSIQMVGRANFSHRELHGKNTSQIDEMLLVRGIDFSTYPIYQKCGSCCIRDDEGHWFIDKEIPMFKGEGREYVERLINCEEE